jgi:hypothetical protein
MATFEDLEKMKYAVIEEYGIRLRGCLDIIELFNNFSC